MPGPDNKPSKLERAVAEIKKAEEYLSLKDPSKPVSPANVTGLVKDANSILKSESGNFLLAITKGNSSTHPVTGKRTELVRFPDEVVQQLNPDDVRDIIQSRNKALHNDTDAEKKVLSDEQYSEKMGRVKKAIDGIDRSKLSPEQNEYLDRYKKFAEKPLYNEADVNNPARRPEIVRDAAANREVKGVGLKVEAVKERLLEEQKKVITEKIKAEDPQIKEGDLNKRIKDEVKKIDPVQDKQTVNAALKKEVPEAATRNRLAHDYSLCDGIELETEKAAKAGTPLSEQYRQNGTGVKPAAQAPHGAEEAGPGHGSKTPAGEAHSNAGQHSPSHTSESPTQSPQRHEVQTTTADSVIKPADAPSQSSHAHASLEQEGGGQKINITNASRPEPVTALSEANLARPATAPITSARPTAAPAPLSTLPEIHAPTGGMPNIPKVAEVPGSALVKGGFRGVGAVMGLAGLASENPYRAADKAAGGDQKFYSDAAVASNGGAIAADLLDGGIAATKYIKPLSSIGSGVGVWGKALGPAGIALGVGAGALEATAAVKAGDGLHASEATGRAAGSVLGAFGAGAAAGAAIGVWGAGIGAVPGAVIGGVVAVGGAFIGGWLGGKAAKAAFGDNWQEKLDAEAKTVRDKNIGELSKVQEKFAGNVKLMQGYSVAAEDYKKAEESKDPAAIKAKSEVLASATKDLDRLQSLSADEKTKLGELGSAFKKDYVRISNIDTAGHPEAAARQVQGKAKLVEAVGTVDVINDMDQRVTAVRQERQAIADREKAEAQKSKALEQSKEAGKDLTKSGVSSQDVDKVALQNIPKNQQVQQKQMSLA